MENIVKSLLFSTYYLETWDEETIEPDVSSDALSQIAFVLKNVPSEEVKILEKVAITYSLSHKDEEFRVFCKGFVEHYIVKYEDNWA